MLHSCPPSCDGHDPILPPLSKLSNDDLHRFVCLHAYVITRVKLSHEILHPFFVYDLVYNYEMRACEMSKIGVYKYFGNKFLFNTVSFNM